MDKSTFVYVTYIRTTTEKLWDALTQPEFTRQYWFGVTQETTWEAGSPWKMILPDGTVADAGELVVVDKPRRIVIKWRNEFRPELHAEGFSQCTIELEPIDDVVQLTVTHEMDISGSKLIEAVGGGWPAILSSLKSMLETGQPLPESARPAKKG